jgi:hypothetical protein
MVYLIVIVFLYLAFRFGNQLGLEAGKLEKEREFFLNDPDHDKEGEKNGNLQFLLFTKNERYKYGRAMVLGTPKERIEAKKKLEETIDRVKAIAIESRIQKFEN